MAKLGQGLLIHLVPHLNHWIYCCPEKHPRQIRSTIWPAQSSLPDYQSMLLITTNSSKGLSAATISIAYSVENFSTHAYFINLLGLKRNVEIIFKTIYQKTNVLEERTKNWKHLLLKYTLVSDKSFEEKDFRFCQANKNIGRMIFIEKVNNVFT